MLLDDVTANVSLYGAGGLPGLHTALGIGLDIYANYFNADLPLLKQHPEIAVVESLLYDSSM